MISTVPSPQPVPNSPGSSTASPWPSALSELKHETLVIKEDDLFLITDPLGNVTGRENPANYAPVWPTITGLFCRDTRVLSHSELQIAGCAPILLGNNSRDGFSLEVIATNPAIPQVLPGEKIGIRRTISLRGRLFEEIELRNYSVDPLTFQVSLSLGADFRDLFEVRQFADRPQRGQAQVQRSAPNQLEFVYRGLCGQHLSAEVTITHRSPSAWVGSTLLWDLHLGPQETICLGYQLTPKMDGEPMSQIAPVTHLAESSRISQIEQDHWHQRATRIRSNSEPLNEVIAQAEQDIYLLLQSFSGGKVLAAGIPWYSTLFGRDAIIAAQQTLMLDATIARDTLRTLAQFQGRSDSDWHDEAPGKILHELRLGEMARCHEIPHTPYYGTIDATPLWILLYGDYFDWSHDQGLMDELWPNALAAMAWIESARDRRGYLSYRKRSQRGLDNQGWKDSGDCIVDAQGKMATGAIALCEVQAYMYGAYQRMAALAERRAQLDLSRHWRTQAAALKEQFNQDFWMPEAQFLALALTDTGEQIDSITSNPGHCLGSGILDLDKAEQIADRLMAPDLYSGWGVRTLSSESPAYNPMSYHMGSIWPHDNALIALGLRTLGKTDAAFQLVQSLLEMTQMQNQGRPPELFCGFDRQTKQGPVSYPVACSPQAWATGSIFQFLQLMLNPVPDAAQQRLTLIHPALPATLTSLFVGNLSVGSAQVDLLLTRQGSHTHCEVVRRSGDLRVEIL
ncbi:amylo-alpha-1,6-glucosidase [Lyngbya confervoides]|uniref:Amylo-alpha-1,6-glucosidase n=1 Tax=Lyngbya confervoides BDU141951 TaxID=1574623 RepID=A0ABD4SZY0_9CYAN|nr:amylo-alpha-1,6-glucosidase [Lyngbya confervoides]MCM1981877.1 amylo-alpha-1,6-glucosidase [Lyngbya confervoides BDU141951]